MVNIASTAGALKAKIKNVDNLDCVSVYCRCDPNKEGAVESSKICKLIEAKTENLRNFVAPVQNIKLKKWFQFFCCFYIKQFFFQKNDKNKSKIIT